MRGRREERREERQDDRQLGRPGGGGNRYQMRQKMVAIGDDFWIENEHGQKVYKVDGKTAKKIAVAHWGILDAQVLAEVRDRAIGSEQRLTLESAAARTLTLPALSLPSYSSSSPRIMLTDCA